MGNMIACHGLSARVPVELVYCQQCEVLGNSYQGVLGWQLGLIKRRGMPGDYTPQACLYWQLALLMTATRAGSAAAASTTRAAGAAGAAGAGHSPACALRIASRNLAHGILAVALDAVDRSVGVFH
jgi:hypothetical protein